MYCIICIKYYFVFSVLKIFNFLIRSRLVFFMLYLFFFFGGYIDFWLLLYDVVVVNIKKEVGLISMIFIIFMYNVFKL